MLWGILMFFVLPDNPTNARWLSISERKLAVERLRANQTGIESKRWKRGQALEALTDVKILVFFLMGYVFMDWSSAFFIV
jgi:hypothetical protein